MGVRPDAPTIVFARLAAGAFHETIVLRTFYEFILLRPRKKVPRSCASRNCAANSSLRSVC